MLSYVPIVLSLVTTNAISALAQTSQSTLFERGTVIAFNEDTQDYDILRNASVLVTGDTITGIFSSNQSVNAPTDVTRISADNAILSPGFIDTHRHGWQTSYRTLVSNTTLADYAIRIGPGSTIPGAFTDEDFYLGELIGLWEGLDAGVTGVLDYSHGFRSSSAASALLDAYLESGARIWFCYGFSDANGTFPLPQRIADFRTKAQDPRLIDSPVEMGVAVDGWTLPPDTIAPLLDLIRGDNISVLSTHYVDGVWGFRNTPSLLRQLGLINESFPIVFAHASFIPQSEYEILRQFNHYISIDPESESHYGHTNDESDYTMDQGALGVDTHATYSGDIVTQARLWLQQVRARSFRRTLEGWRVPSTNPMSVKQAFHLATRAGAQALRRPDLGVIRVGAKADIVVFDGTKMSLLGFRDPIAAIILHSNVGDVRDVMVNGRFVKRDGQLLNTNLANVTSAFVRTAPRIQDIIEAAPLSPTEGSWIIGGYPYEQPRQVDAVRGNATG
ncbi:Amidohydrolase-like protein 2 [Elsinoe fawcettii]|nr:Amidohydrolase-like protein 2 [Elsinoe fawcettii]